MYSDKYMESVDFEKYLDKNFIVSAMTSRIKNFKDDNYMVSFVEMTAIRAIDHYMCKKIVNGEDMDNLLNTYINTIKLLSVDNPFIFYSLPISRIKSDILVKYIPDIDAFSKQLILKGNEIFKLYEKFINDDNSLSDLEFKRLVEYFYYRVDNDNLGLRTAMDKFIRYLLNNKNMLNYQELSLILKYFGHIKCLEENLTDTEIIIADISNPKKPSRGFSTGNSAILSKKLLIKSSFLENKLEKKNGNNGNYIEGLSHLHVLFHELRHQKQSYECKNFIKSDISYFMASKAIIHLFNTNDYINNYSFYETEKDANYFAWSEVEKIIKNYLSSKNFFEALLNIKKHKYSELIELVCSSRKNGKKIELSRVALCQLLDKYFSQNPMYLLEKYKQFNVFYDLNGEPKSLFELLSLTAVDNYSEFYFEQVIYRCNVKSKKDNSFNSFSLNQKRRILNMIYRTIDYVNLKLTTISDYKNSGFNIESIDGNEKLLIGENIKYYIKNINNLLDLFILILSSDVELYNSDIVRNYANKINNCLLKINNNYICNLYNKKKILLINIDRGNNNGYRR